MTIQKKSKIFKNTFKTLCHLWIGIAVAGLFPNLVLGQDVTSPPPRLTWMAARRGISLATRALGLHHDRLASTS